MSNRKRPSNDARLTELVTCPDCASEVTLAPTDEHGVRYVAIAHDDTCPWWRTFQARGVPAIRFISCDENAS
jgi:hypothetical protein